MITPNTDSSFIQVKSVRNGSIFCAEQDCVVAEVVEVTAQGSVEKSRALSGMKRVSRIGKRMEVMDDLLLSAVDETFEQIFKGAGARVIYKFMENKCHLRRKEIAEKPEVFSAGLERLLGSAAPLVEKMILKNLHSKLELRFEEREGYGFSEYIEELKEKCRC